MLGSASNFGILSNKVRFFFWIVNYVDSSGQCHCDLCATKVSGRFSIARCVMKSCGDVNTGVLLSVLRIFEMTSLCCLLWPGLVPRLKQ